MRARTSTATQAPSIDLEDADTAEGIDLPGADLSHEELTVAVVVLLPPTQRTGGSARHALQGDGPTKARTAQDS
nr:DUF4193 family protein [Kocuria turfanensis]